MLFISSQSLFSFLRYLNVCSDVFDREGKALSSIGKQIIPIHLLPFISRSKGNHTMIFGQLIGHNVRNKSYRKRGEESGSRHLFVLQRDLYEVKSKCSTHIFQYILKVLNLGIQYKQTV